MTMTTQPIPTQYQGLCNTDFSTANKFPLEDFHSNQPEDLLVLQQYLSSRLGYGSPYNNIYRNTWLRDRNSAARRSDTDTSATEEKEKNIRLKPKLSN